MMTVYKLTTQGLTTHGGFKWIAGKWVVPPGVSNKACSNGVLHYYDDPRLALLFNPIHANVPKPRVWEMEIECPVGHDGLKGWCKRARLVREITPVEITTAHRVAFAIYCAGDVYKDPAWSEWARKWMSGEDRSSSAAYAAAYAATRAAAYAATRAADAAATRAADAAAYAATRAAYAAAYAVADAAARAAANAAAYAAYAADAVDKQRARFIQIADVVFGK